MHLSDAIRRSKQPRGFEPRYPHIEVKAKMTMTSIRVAKIVTDERWGIETWLNAAGKASTTQTLELKASRLYRAEIV